MAAALAILFGWCGAHLFYIRQSEAGLDLLSIGLTWLPYGLPFVWLFAIFQGVRYLFQTDLEFENKAVGL